jgi:hypothetical protein
MTDSVALDRAAAIKVATSAGTAGAEVAAYVQRATPGLAPLRVVGNMLLARGEVDEVPDVGSQRWEGISSTGAPRLPRVRVHPDPRMIDDPSDHAYDNPRVSTYLSLEGVSPCPAITFWRCERSSPAFF